jgi:predicted nucleic acid-binding protein
MAMLDASLDTSFWNIAAQIGVVPYLFAFFRVHYCQAVEDEIVTTDSNETPLIYPQAMLFKVLKEDSRLHHAEPQQHLALFGDGEAYAISLAQERAISLAQERSWVLLINDYRPLQFARSLGIQCVSVPDFCVLLYAEARVTLRAVRGYLRRLTPTTSPSLLREAEAVVTDIARKRGEA